jgi:branched-chain amino acid transport system permease protein
VTTDAVPDAPGSSPAAGSSPALGPPVDADPGADGVAGAVPGDAVGLYPPVPRPVLMARVAIGVVLAFLALYAPFYFEPATNRLLSQAIYLAVAAMGLNLLTGFNGQISIGHGAFFGVGAFTSGILVVDHGWAFETTIPIAALLSAALGVAVGFPALRVRGLYLALITLGLAVLFPRVASKYVESDGGVALLKPSRRDFSSLVTFLDDDQWVYFLSLAIAVVLFVLAWNLVRSRVGRAMVAVRDQELAAVTVGVGLRRTKITSFAISAAYAGIAGSLSVMVDRIADGTSQIVYFQRSIEFLVAVVIGGAATILGPAVGALLLVALRRNTEDLIEGKEILAPAIFGGALILIVFVLPEGVVGGVRRLLARLGRPAAGPRPSSSAPPGPPPEVADAT